MRYIILSMLVLCLLCLVGCAKSKKGSNTVSTGTTSIDSTASIAPIVPDDISSNTAIEVSSVAPNIPSEVMQPPSDTMVHLKDASGKEFTAVFLRPTGTTSWKNIKLYPSPLVPDSDFLCNLTAAQIAIATHWDVKMIDKDQNEYVWAGIDMTRTAFVDLNIVNGQTSFQYK